MAKVRVYELAQELGVDSRTLMERLGELGEWVRSASSTIEPQTVRRLRLTYPPSAPPPIHTGRTEPPGAAAPQPWHRPAMRYVPPRTPRTSRSRPSATDTSEAVAIFGEDAVRRTSQTHDGTRTNFSDGYGLPWQSRIISHGTFTEFVGAGLDSWDAELADQCLLADLRPIDLSGQLGDRTVLTWLREGYAVELVAKTLRECRADPANPHLIDSPVTPER